MAFQVEIFTPERRIVQEEATFLKASGLDGEFGILTNHAALLAGLKPGNLILTKPDGTQRTIHTAGGFLEVKNNQVVILADSCALDPTASC